MGLSRRRKSGLRGNRGWVPALIIRAPALCLAPLWARLLEHASRCKIYSKNIYVVQKHQIKKVGL